MGCYIVYSDVMKRHKPYPPHLPMFVVTQKRLPETGSNNMKNCHHSERKKFYQSQIMGACKKMIHPILNMFFYLTIQMPFLVSILILQVGLDKNLPISV